MSTKLLIAITGIVILIVGLTLLGNKIPKSSQPTPTVNNADSITPKVQEVTIMYSKQGFLPQTVTITKGTRVLWKNESGGVATVNSANHPTHQVYPPLNLGEFNNNTAVQLVFDTPGTYSYHNHLNPAQSGVINVE